MSTEPVDTEAQGMYTLSLAEQLIAQKESEVARLTAENARLTALLETYVQTTSR